MPTLITAYLLVINATAFLAFGIDKYKAKHGKWRISETTLLLLALLGGSLGAWCGMQVWHHKTMPNKFRFGVPAILFLQITLATWIACDRSGWL